MNGRGCCEQIESSDIQKLLEPQGEDLSESELKEIFNLQCPEDEASKSIENVEFNKNNLKKGLRMENYEVSHISFYGTKSNFKVSAVYRSELKF